MMRLLLAFAMSVLPLFAKAGDDWNTSQKMIGGAALAATFIDYGQTRWIAIHCNDRERVNCYGEINPLLGRHPSVGRVNTYFAIVPALEFVIADNLSSEKRTVFLSAIAGLEIGITAHNAHVGYRISF